MTTTLRLFAVPLLMLVLACTTLIGGGCDRALHVDHSRVDVSSYDSAWSDLDELAADTSYGSAPMCLASISVALDPSQPSDDLDKELMTWNDAGEVVSHLAPQWLHAEPWLAPPSLHASELLRPPRA